MNVQPIPLEATAMTDPPETISIPKWDMPVNDGFMSVSYCSDRPLSVHKFQSFLDNLPTEVFRAKGLLWFSESAHKHVFQLSGKRYTLEVEHWKASPRSNQLMFIGRNLDSEKTRQNLADCQSMSPSLCLGNKARK